MADGMLSQEEINALMAGTNNDSGTTAVEKSTDEAKSQLLTDEERDILGEVGNISMGSAATTLSILLNEKVDITTPRVTTITLEVLKEEYPAPYLVVEVPYAKGLSGTNLLAIKEHDALVISNLMMGGDGINLSDGLDEISMSAVGEAMNQMMGSASTSLSTMLKRKIDISPPNLTFVDFASSAPITTLVSETDDLVKVAFAMKVGSLIDSEFMQLITFDVARELVELLNKKETESAVVNELRQGMDTPASAAAPPPQMVIPQQQPQMMMPPPQQQQMMYQQQPQMMYQQQPMAQQQPMMNQVPIQAVQFAPLQPTFNPNLEGNFGLLMDVPLQVTVELGRARKLIKEIVDFSPGSVIELDKLAGESADIYVNGKLIAKGEVVVIDENFGVRITEITSKFERMRELQ